MGLGIAVRLGGTFYHFLWFDAVSLLLCLAGLALAVGGRAVWRWAWPSIAFLMFMIPLPHTLAVAMTNPLQRVATVASTFMLQTFGLPAVADGNVIHLNDVELGIVEACSGLRMLVVFFALSTAVALVVQRPLWERLVLVLSAVPIALLANTVRITATGILHETAGRAVADVVFHDLAGWLMMPLALAFMWGELKIMQKLFLDPTPAGMLVPAQPRPTAGTPSVPRRQKWVKQPGDKVPLATARTP